MKLWCLLLLLSSPALAAGLQDVPDRGVEILQRLPRDPSLFTQGLLVLDGQLYHSGGKYGESRLVAGKPGSASHRFTRHLPPSWFAEGIAVVGSELFLLTWRNGITAVFDSRDLAPRRRLAYQGEGWGLTSDGSLLIMSNGSSELLWRDPINFSIQRRLQVLAGETSVRMLNELEWIDGVIYANIWQSDYLVGIDPETGQVLQKTDLGELLSSRERRRAGVVNGIAWDAKARRLYVTGKHWPWLFEIRLLAPDLPGRPE